MFKPGDVIDTKYRVSRLIGQGGMGAVYEGENTRISRRVAIKVLRAEAATRPELRARFQREARAAGQIGSKHVCDVLDLGDLPSGESYLVMEYLEGEDLSVRLKARGRIGDAEALAIAFQLTDGLATMHEAGIIHRDLKPANVFLARGARGDTVKILDFGVSKFTGDAEALEMTKTGAVMGTPLYMSPEQARGARDTDARSDLYSVGVVLFRAVTGTLPFKGDNFHDILFKIALEVPPPVLSLAPDVDPAFAEIIERAMSKEPADRYQTGRELQEALRALGTARGLVLETALSVPPSLTPGRGVTPLPPLPRPSKVPSASSLLAAPRAAGPSPAHAATLTAASQLQKPSQMQEIVADGFTSTAWAEEGNGGSSDALFPSHSSHPPAVSQSGSQSGSQGGSQPRSQAAPSAPGATRLAARLEEENRLARARSRTVMLGFAGAAVLAVSIAGGVFALTRASLVAPAPIAVTPPNATANTTPPPGEPAAQPVASSGTGTGAGTVPAASDPADTPGVAIGALPLVAAGSPATGPQAGPARRPTGSNPAPAASSAPAAKAAWGPIAPAVPTIERSGDAPTP